MSRNPNDKPSGQEFGQWVANLAQSPQMRDNGINPAELLRLLDGGPNDRDWRQISQDFAVSLRNR